MIIKNIKHIVTTILNSYSIVFFSTEKYFALLLLFVSFLNPYSGFAGLFSVCTSLLLGYLLGFNQTLLTNGLLSFNALLLGIGIGSIFQTSATLYSTLIFTALFTLLFSVILNDLLGKKGLPFLTLPFILTFWLILLTNKEFPFLVKNQYQFYTIASIELTNIPNWVSIYLKSLSAIFFQENILAGILIAIGFLIYSRIAFSLTIIGFVFAYWFTNFLGLPITSASYINLGCNYILVAFAIGCFFIIPSIYSYLLVLFSVPLTGMLIIALSKVLSSFSLPLFSTSFSLTVILLLYFLKLRVTQKKIILTPLQYFSPEVNLYQFRNSFERLNNAYLHNFYLPFLGEWMVSQGYNGGVTHKEDWSDALDFVILDNEMKTYSGEGKSVENFYCYGKPILAPADGIVHEIKDNIDDNEIGEIDMVNNWGNTIVIYHLPGLYSKLSHLKKNSFHVKIGDRVKRGDILALCGNSGRSPEPHLHFQVQSTPHIGSKTLSYPMAYYLEKNKSETIFKSYSSPEEGTLVTNLETNSLLRQAFLFQPGFIGTYSANGITETWEAFTDAYNLTYIWCKQTNSIAYFINNGTVFYFTNFTGDKKSLLSLFYLSAYKVVLSFLPHQQIEDTFPVSLIGNQPIKWLQDFIAPFYQFINPVFKLAYSQIDTPYYTNSIVLESTMLVKYAGIKIKTTNSIIKLQDGAISEINIKIKNSETNIVCVSHS